MEIRIKRGQDENSNYYAIINVVGDEQQDFRPFILPIDIEEINVDDNLLSLLEIYMPRFDNIISGDFDNAKYIKCCNEIKLVGKSIMRIQKAIEYVVERIKSNYKYAKRCKELWSSGKEEVIKLD